MEVTIGCRNIRIEMRDGKFVKPNELLLLVGMGTALKPATEHWILCRRPLSESTVAKNVLRWGTAGINIDACRVESGPDHAKNCNRSEVESHWRLNGSPRAAVYASPLGRWPTNLCLSHHPDCRRIGVKKVKGHAGYPNGPGGSSCQLSQKGTPTTRTDAWGGYADPDGTETVDEWECHESCPVAELDRQSGERPSSARRPGQGCHPEQIGPTGLSGKPNVNHFPASTGGASRFFPQFQPEVDVPFLYQAKASRSERSLGLPDGVKSGHPTVKPLKLMSWLCRLVCPPGGVILDPFAGSGTTGCAAVLEGFNFIGIDKCDEYVQLARARIAYWEQQTQYPLFSCCDAGDVF